MRLRLNDPTMKKRILLVACIGLSVLLTIGLACYAIKQNDALNDDFTPRCYYDNTLSAPYIPEQLTFAGEEVPLDIYWVRESLDRELIGVCYQHSLTLMTFKLSGRWLPVIEPILKEEGLPDDFKYLCMAESNLRQVVSPAKAAGFWQFMDATAKLYGLEVREDVDERYHVEKATRAACRYLKGSKERLGSWALAAAAYNMGEGGVKKNMTAQSCDNYWDLYLNQETARYMYRILAYKCIFENPQQYGVRLTKADLYSPIPTKDVEVTTSIPDLYKFAQDHHTTYRELKELNPWLRSKKLTVGEKKYTIKVPKKSKESFFELFRSNHNTYQHIGDTL